MDKRAAAATAGASPTSTKVSTNSSSLPSHPPGPNPIAQIVNDYYAKQQAAYMQRRRQTKKDVTGGSSTSQNSSTSPHKILTADSVIVSPPTYSRNASAASFIDPQNASAISVASGASSGKAPPVDRLLLWAERRESALKQIRQEEDEREHASTLTFQPDLARARREAGAATSSTLSTSVVTTATTATTTVLAREPPVANIPYGQQQVGGRLADDTSVAQHPVDSNSNSSQLRVAERLLAFGDLRDRRLEHLRSVRDKQLSDEHPFQPLSAQSERRSASANQVSRNLAASSTESREFHIGARQKPDQRDPECTFHPTVNHRRDGDGEPPVRPENVFKRLYSWQSDGEQSSVNDTRQGRGKSAQSSFSSHLPSELLAELNTLRLHVGAPAKDAVRSDAFDVFITNVCQDCPSVVHSSYVSPAAAKLREVRRRQEAKWRAAAAVRDVSPHQFVVADRDDTQRVGLALPDDSGNDRPMTGGVDSVSSGQAAYVSGEAEDVTSSSLVPFQEFLVRQEAAFRVKHRKLERLQQQLAPVLKPTLCDHSRALCSHRKNATMAVPTTNGDSRATRSQSAYFPFRPVITRAGTNCPPRGAEDMHLDGKRQLERRKHSLDTYEKELLAGVTFQPQTNRERNARVQSTLNPKNFHVFEQQLERQKAEREARRVDKERHDLMEEFSECTFQPQLNKLPAFVVAMNSATAVLRGAGI